MLPGLHPGRLTGTPSTLREFHAELLRQPEAEARDVALAIELFTEGSLNTFAKPTNVNTSARILCYDIRDLGKQLLPVGMLVVLDSVFNRIVRNRALGRNTWVYIDEIYLLFQHEYQKLADLLNQENIPFSQEAPAWDKHKVKRLLEDPRYIGQKGYPAILDGETFHCVQSCIREKTAKQTPKAERPALKLVSRLRCSACGAASTDGRPEPPERYPVPEMRPMRHCHHPAGRSPAG